MNMVVMDESQGEIDFSDSSSKLGSVVKINSIAIDISSSMEITESPAHEHFSIRGFVAGMRKKDLKTCFPFASVGNDVDSEDNLPPLFVPEFRWWQCSSCITNAEMTRITEKKAVATQNDAHSNSCDNVGGKNGLFIQRRENTASKGKTYVRGTEARNSCAMPEVNLQQVIKRLSNTPDMACLVERPLCIVDEPDNASSGSEDSFSVMPHKRKPKLRYLADILVGERSENNSNYRTGSASSCGMQVASTEMEAVFIPQLEVDVPANIAKSGRTPERKRKIALSDESEDREPLAAICPRAAAKKLKGLLLDGGENSRRVKFFDLESKGDASTRLHLPRTDWIKPQKAKAIETRKKMRRICRDDEIGQMIESPQRNAASSENIPDQAIPMETTLGRLEGARSALFEIRHALEETRPCFRSSLSRRQVEKIDDLSSVSMPEAGADDGPLIPLSKCISGNHNIKGNVALDQSLDSSMDTERNPNDQESLGEHRCIPDLNIDVPEKTALTEGQPFTVLSEKRSLPLHKKLDAASSSNENVREDKPEMGISEPKNKDNNSVELGADDIPMEIVELLARNQHERSLGNSRRHMLGFNNSMRGYSAVDVDQHPGTINFPLPSIINGFTVKNGNMGVGTNVSTNFPRLKHCQFDTSRLEKNHFRPLSSFALNQPRKPEYFTSTSVMEVPRSGSGAELLWPSSREKVPFCLSIPQNRLIQPRGIHANSSSDQCHKGKDGKGKKAISDVAKLKERRSESVYPPIGSLDPYSNNTIPAMQLLSLMDQRVKSGSSSEVGTKCSINKPFSPCKHHPPLNEKENHNFLYGSPFPKNSSSKDFSWLRYGVHSSIENSERASSTLRAQVPQELRNPKNTLLDESSNLEERPAGSNEALGECTVNRNPADFSIPGAGNQFTLTAKDLNPRRRNAFKVKPAAGKVDGRKRQRMRNKVVT